MRLSSTSFDAAAVLAAAALLLPSVAVLVPLGIAPLAGAAALLTLAPTLLRERRWPIGDRTTLIAVALFCGWAALSTLWSVDPARSITAATRVAVICIGGLVLVAAAMHLDARQRTLVARALAIGATVGAVLLAIDFATEVGLNRLLDGDSPALPIKLLNRTASVVAVLIWPLVIVVGARWRTAGIIALLVVAALALTQFEPEVPSIAFAAATLVFVAAQWRARTVATIVAAGIAALVLVLPILPHLAPHLDAELTAEGANENSVSHRLGIWTFSTGRALEKPVTGWGMDTSRAIPGGSVNLLIQGRANADAPAIPLHPHNATVQLWLELGPPGLLLVAFLVMRAVRRIPQVVAGRRETAATLAAATALLVVANLSYGIWQGWWLCFIWLAVALTLALTRRPAEPSMPAAMRPARASDVRRS